MIGGFEYIYLLLFNKMPNNHIMNTYSSLIHHTICFFFLSILFHWSSTVQLQSNKPSGKMDFYFYIFKPRPQTQALTNEISFSIKHLISLSWFLPTHGSFNGFSSLLGPGHCCCCCYCYCLCCLQYLPLPHHAI